MRLTLYHGSNAKITNIDYKYMNDGNNQEGVGIYFSPDKKVARHYGKHIISIEVDTNRFINSRKLVIDINIIQDKLSELIKNLYKYNPEDFFYTYTDYFDDIYQLEDMTVQAAMKLADVFLNEQIRYLQILLADIAGVENFAKQWVKTYPNILGTFGQYDDFYAIIHKLKIKKL